MSSEDEGREGERLDNQPFDEAHFVDDPEEIASNLAVTPVSSRVNMEADEGDVPPYGGHEFDDGHDGYGNPDEDGYEPAAAAADDYGGGDGGVGADLGYDDGEDGHHDDGDMAGGEPMLDRGGTIAAEDDEDVEGQYNPADYASLNVSADVQDLFQYIDSFVPTRTAIETQLDPFIPDYIPAVGDIDAMIKVGAPERIDGVDDSIGLTVIDEPCAAQSDPAVLDLQLRAIAKTATNKPAAVSQVADLAKNGKTLDNWIESITELHREKPPQTIQFSTPMPDVELLMQEWPPEVEALLKTVELPSAELDVQLKHFVSIVCAVLDIPVHGSKVEALHLLFSLFVEFKQSQGFRSKEDPPPAAPPVDETEVMQIAAP
mmetsp:Transcript_25025/g.75430  ORF Transcript_25025/g.75430 Transcript_25025/m.75430 type:complete len:374 (-) Transcript_25025:84-1205(-)